MKIERRIDRRLGVAAKTPATLAVASRSLQGALIDVSSTGAKLFFETEDYASVRELLAEALLSQMQTRLSLDGRAFHPARIVWYGIAIGGGFALGLEFAEPLALDVAASEQPLSPMLLWGVRHRPEREAELALTLGDVFRDLSKKEFVLGAALELLCSNALSLVGADAVIFWALENGDLVLRAQAGAIALEIGSLFPERGRYIPDFAVLKKTLLRKQQLFANEAQRSPFADHSGVRQFGLQSLMFIPVFGHETDFGVLMFSQSENPYAFGFRAQAEAEIFANQAALFLEKASMLKNLEESATFFEGLNRIALSFHRQLDIDGVLKMICEESRALFQVDVATVYLRENGFYVQRAAAGMAVNPEPIDRAKMRLAESSLVDGGEGFFINDVEHHELANLELFQRHLAKYSVRSLMVLPICGGGKTLGTLALADGSNAHRYSSRDLEKGSLLAEQAAQALVNARLYERVVQSKQIIRQQDRFRILGELASVVGHELKNALVPIRTLADLLPTRYDDPDFREWYSKTVRQEIERMYELVGQLSRFRTTERRSPEPVEPAVLMQNVVELVNAEARSRSVTLEFQSESAPQVSVVANELRQVLLNLILNAIQAVDRDGVVRVGVRRDEQSGGAILWVSDSGPGIPADKLERIFEPLFTTKQNGSGLGLAVARDLVNSNGGSIEVASLSGRGTTFTVLLPGASVGVAAPSVH